ncbi:hypothetical protein AVEN_261803-1 [Araneus ventricosus]|uniref:Uncharacterized protein n=1 Tax=Araneus ventricosus TaxID=182803 RepID=A0A4Y2M210_ARAVE|nr:hypothetical protein AVEN_261803-1 [Araneus ventricosus]
MGSNPPNPQPQWPLDGGGNPTYPTNADGDEHYLRVDNEDLILETPQGPRYAHDKDGNEFYPKNSQDDDKFINSLYALDKDRSPKFPKNKTDEEFYVEDGYGSSIISIDGVQIRYAKTQSTEIYPIEFIGLGMVREVVLNNTYAKTTSGEHFYPLDEFGNEYTITIIANGKVDDAKSFLKTHPITNDNYVIVPNVWNKPHFLPSVVPAVEVKNIVGRLFRSANGYRDYFTDVKDNTRKPRGSAKQYNYLVAGTLEPTPWVPASLTSEETISHWYWLFIILFILMVILVIPFAFIFWKNRW